MWNRFQGFKKRHGSVFSPFFNATQRAPRLETISTGRRRPAARHGTTSTGRRRLHEGVESLPRHRDGQRSGLEPVPRPISGRRRPKKQFQSSAQPAPRLGSSSKASRRPHGGLEPVPRPFPAGDGAWNHFHGRFRPETSAKPLSTGGDSGTIQLSLRMRPLCLLSLQPTNPKIVAGEGKRGSDQRREEAEQASDGPAPSPRPCRDRWVGTRALRLSPLDRDTGNNRLQDPDRPSRSRSTCVFEVIHSSDGSGLFSGESDFSFIPCLY